MHDMMILGFERMLANRNICILIKRDKGIFQGHEKRDLFTMQRQQSKHGGQLPGLEEWLVQKSTS